MKITRAARHASRRITALTAAAAGRGAADGGRDSRLMPAELLAMTQQAHAHITMIPGAPHLSMIYDPGLVTRVILEAAHATS